MRVGPCLGCLGCSGFSYIATDYPGRTQGAPVPAPGCCGNVIVITMVVWARVCWRVDHAGVRRPAPATCTWSVRSATPTTRRASACCTTRTSRSTRDETTTLETRRNASRSWKIMPAQTPAACSRTLRLTAAVAHLLKHDRGLRRRRRSHVRPLRVSRSQMKAIFLTDFLNQAAAQRV